MSGLEQLSWLLYKSPNKQGQMQEIEEGGARGGKCENVARLRPLY